MNFAFNQEQMMIKDQAAHFLSNECPLSRVREILENQTYFDQDLWQGLAELGWQALTIPEEYDGLGLGYLELAVIAEELGKALAPVPFLSSVVLATEIIKQADEQTKATFLPQLASGKTIGCIALTEDFNKNITAKLGLVSGDIKAAVDAQIADFMIVKIHEETENLYLIDLHQDSVKITALESLDPTMPLSAVSFNQAKAERIVTEQSTNEVLSSVLDIAAVITSFAQIGLANSAMQQGIDYTKSRYAFGRQVASFQAIKHKFADMFVQLELAKSNSYYGAWAVSSGHDALPLAAATARLSASKAVDFITKENIQVHGGMGFTWEFDCHLFYRRGHFLNILLATQDYWQQRLIDKLIDAGDLKNV